MSLTRDDVRQGIFGVSDGAATTIGAMFGLYASGHRAAILVATLAAGLSATESMGAGEYLSDDSSSVHRALAMATGTAIGGILPAIPFALGRGLLNLVAAAALTGALGAWVAEERAKAPTLSRARAYAQVLPVFVVVATSTYLLGILL